MHEKKAYTTYFSSTGIFSIRLQVYTEQTPYHNNFLNLVDENDYDELDIQEEIKTYCNLRLTPLKDNIHFEENPNRPILITDLLSVIQTLEKHSCRGFKREYEVRILNFANINLCIFPTLS